MPSFTPLITFLACVKGFSVRANYRADILRVRDVEFVIHLVVLDVCFQVRHIEPLVVKTPIGCNNRHKKGLSAQG
jgi:hypothetical protein